MVGVYKHDRRPIFSSINGLHLPIHLRRLADRQINVLDAHNGLFGVCYPEKFCRIPKKHNIAIGKQRPARVLENRYEKSGNGKFCGLVRRRIQIVHQAPAIQWPRQKSCISQSLLIDRNDIASERGRSLRCYCVCLLLSGVESYPSAQGVAPVIISEPPRPTDIGAGTLTTQLRESFMAKRDLTAERLREVLHYDPETGIFTWLIKPRRDMPVGSQAGCINPEKHPHIAIGIRRTSYSAHHLAWLYITGDWPIGNVAHKNGDGHDNRWANLSLAKQDQSDDLTAAQLRELLDYDPDTGIFTWKVRVGRGEAGSQAGSIRLGYVKIKINHRGYPAHHLAWLLMTGEWPVALIDHRNRIRNDNRWSNLRPATHKQNLENLNVSKNSKTGIRGVRWLEKEQRWKAGIKHCGISINLGKFSTIEEAITARLTVERKLFTHSDACELPIENHEHSGPRHGTS